MTVRRNREEWKIYGNVFDTFTKGVLHSLQSQDHFGELSSAIALGKEANIFTATPGRGKTEAVVVKIYRLENCNFRKMYEYLRQDPRYMSTKPGKRQIVFAWCQREYRNLLLARETIRVPTPLAFRHNVLVMELIGKNGVPARQLKDLPPKGPKRFAEKVLRNMQALWKAGLVHGDLSAFNILNHDEEPVFIDFSQASTTNAPNAKELLERDRRNVLRYFEKAGVRISD